MHATYIHKAGGPLRVVAQLQAFYESKYTPDRDDSQLAQAVLDANVSGHSPPIQCITVDEINFLCNTDKSCGTESVPYELLQCIMQTDLADEIVEFMNSVLNGSVEVPPNWLVNNVAFWATSEPDHLRPIVLSTTMCKTFTKILLLQLRPKFPPTAFGQLCGIQNSQTLDGSLSHSNYFTSQTPTGSHQCS